MTIAAPPPVAEQRTSAVADPERPSLLKFGRSTQFQQELRRRVEAHFVASGGQPRDSARMYVKTAIVMAFFAVTYVALVFVAGSAWTAIPLAVLVGIAMAEIGMNIQHDGGHRAFSDRPWVNRLAAMSLDMAGGSSYLWNMKHATIHHTYVNIAGYDDDINLGALARLAPSQKRHWFHRLQHFYMWALYGFMAVKWHLIDDYFNVFTARIGSHRIPRPKGWDLAIFIAGKAAFLSLAFAIPLTRHSFWSVIGCYLIADCVLGISLSIIFQLAHCVEEAEFRLPDGDTNRIESAWAIHQVESSVDFARESRVVSWLLGGLNFQIEHHLFPRISHVHYPAIAPIVERACREFGVRYVSHRSVGAGLRSHYRWLRRMGRS